MIAITVTFKAIISVLSECKQSLETLTATVEITLHFYPDTVAPSIEMNRNDRNTHTFTKKFHLFNAHSLDIHKSFKTRNYSFSVL